MALFSKLNEKIKVNEIETKANEVDYSIIENELIFGTLNSLVEDIISLRDINADDALMNSIHTPGIKNADIPNGGNDSYDHDNDQVIPDISPVANTDLASEVLLSSEVK